MADYASPETFNRRRQMAQLLLMQGSSGEPVQHWAQGANRIAQALFGGINMNAANQEEKTAREQATQQLVAGIKSGGPTPEMLTALGNPMAPPALAHVGSNAVAEALKPKSYGFQTLPDGTILRTDSKGGTVAPIYQAPVKPSIQAYDPDKPLISVDPIKGTAKPVNVDGITNKPTSITLPSGEVISPPPGVDAKKWRDAVSSDLGNAQAGKLTEVQVNATQFANRMVDAEKNIAKVEAANTGLKGVYGQATNLLPGNLGRFIQPKELQQLDQAKGQFITALLRKESGAAINKDEFARYDREFFPQPGDGPEVISQKRGARLVAVEAMKRGAGPVYKPPASAAPDLKAKYGLD